MPNRLHFTQKQYMALQSAHRQAQGLFLLDCFDSKVQTEVHTSTFCMAYLLYFTLRSFCVCI
jgi:hypothetical protein